MADFFPPGEPAPDLPEPERKLFLFLHDIWEQCEVAKPLYGAAGKIALDQIQRVCVMFAAAMKRGG